MRSWALVQTVQANGVCAEVLAPAPNASAATIAKASEIALRVADGLGVTGVLAVELFETTDERILVNELAMRPHNSGHWSIEGSVTSQFEQHLRAVLGWPLGNPAMITPAAVMINLIGERRAPGTPHGIERALAVPGAYIHVYGKAMSGRGRKMGHVTALGATMADAERVATDAAGAIHFGAGHEDA